MAIGRISDLDPARTPRPWLYVTASNLASNYRGLARHKREQYPEKFPEEPAELESAESSLISIEEVEQMRRRVTRLRPKIRAVVIPYVLASTSASATSPFRNPILRPACSLSTLRGHGCPYTAHGHARLASGWRPCLGRTGVEPAGLHIRFRHAFGFTWLPPERGLLGAQRRAGEVRV